MTPKTWFITGAGRGLGRELAIAALARGDTVTATARSVESLSDLDCLTLPLDVTNPPSIHATVSAAVDAHGRLDVVVNNAGVGLMGAVEEVSDAEARALFDVNFFGPLEVIRAVLPVLRAQGSGHIINIGSVGGFVQAAGMGVYGATKFALEAITEALNAECAPLGITATVIEPGALRTDFLDNSSLTQSTTTLDAYTPTAGARRAWAAAINGTQPGNPTAAANAIVDIAHTPHPPTRLQLGTDAITRVEAKLHHVHTELETWRPLATGIDYPPT
ncbi:SDR family NAD(P)-dependent oxidoreductase [Actinokineospora sp. 24-640]